MHIVRILSFIYTPQAFCELSKWGCGTGGFEMVKMNVSLSHHFRVFLPINIRYCFRM